MGLQLICISYQHEQLERVFSILYTFMSYVLFSTPNPFFGFVMN